MKVIFFLLLLISSFSYAVSDDSDHIFIIPLNQCKNLSTNMYNNSPIVDDSRDKSILVCVHSIHFLSCSDSFKNKINFNLAQNVDNTQYVFINHFGDKLILDSLASTSILNQSFISGKSTFVSETCKGLFFKDLKVKDSLLLNDGLKNILNKMDGVVYEK